MSQSTFPQRTRRHLGSRQCVSVFLSLVYYSSFLSPCSGRCGDPVWSACRASTTTPTHARQDLARARPRAGSSKPRKSWQRTSRKVQSRVKWYAPPSCVRDGLQSVHWLVENACKVMAKDLIRTRRYIHKFYQLRTQLQAVGLRIQTLRSNQQMGEAMRGAIQVIYFWVSCGFY